MVDNCLTNSLISPGDKHEKYVDEIVAKLKNVTIKKRLVLRIQKLESTNNHHKRYYSKEQDKEKFRQN